MTSALDTAFAQFPSKFYIGAFWVGGDSQQSWSENPGAIKFLSPYINSSGNPETISLYGLEKPCEIMPQARLRQMDSLGLNLGGFHFNDPNVTVASGRNAIVENLNRTLEVAMTSSDASKNIDICAFTWTTEYEGKGDRIMLHPEDTLDFKVKTGIEDIDYSFEQYNNFDNLSMTGLNLSRCIERGGSGDNCVRISGPCSFSGVPLKRKRELSAFHSAMPSPSDTELNSGLYHVSVVLRADDGAPPPDDDTVLLTVRVTGADGAATVNNNAITTQVLQMVVRGSDFYDGGALRTDPFEVHIGRIELQVDRYTNNAKTPPALDSVLTITDGPLSNRWLRTGSFLTNRLDYWNELHPHRADRNIVKEFDIELAATTDHAFYVDAVCLTSPHSYGLFAPGDGNVLAAHSTARATLDDFMQRLTQYNNGNRLSRVSLITVPEQDPYAGYWRNTRLLQTMIRNYTKDAMGGTTCMAYSAKGCIIDTADMPGLVELHRDMASGYYAYAYDIEYPRWAHETEPNDYYSWSIFGHPGVQPRAGRIWENVYYYRRYAKERKRQNITAPWIPFVQNHSNHSISNFDYDTLRQPNAAELKLMCNLGLAHGAKGLMFYQFNTHGTDPAEAARDSLSLRPLWPQTWEEYKADSTCNLNDPFGSIGFLAGGERPDTVDVHGENKWDSTRKLINDFLRPVGERLLPMTWEMSRSWYAAGGGGERGESKFVSGITTSRMGTSAYTWVDHQDTTLVETAEFKGVGDTTFVFVVNLRTHKEGQRHVCVKLSSQGGTQYKVTDIRNGDVHIVLASDNPDQQSISDGLRLYLDRGEATLLKLEPMGDTTSTFDPCLPSNLYVWRGATLSTTNNQELSFNSGCGIFAEGTFRTAPGTRLQPCIEPWLGVFSRNGGYVELNTTTVVQGSLNVGPLSDALLTDNCEFVECDIALNNLGGNLVSQSTIATSCREYLYQADGETILNGDSVNTWNMLLSQDYAVHVLGGNLYFKRLRLLNQHRGIYTAGNAVVYAGIPGDFTSPRNKIICDNLALHAEEQSYIVAGIESGGTWYYTDNMFQILWSPQTWWPSSQRFHALSNSYIAAQQNFWIHPGAPPAILPDALTSGYVDWIPNLMVNPVPFTGDHQINKLSKGSSGSMSTASTVNDLVKQVLVRIAANDSVGARNALASMISSNALSNAQPHQLNALVRFTRRHSRGQLQSLVTVLDNRNELSCKLILSDLFRGEGLYDDALRTLYSHGFGGVSAQARHAHALKAMTCAMDRRYGYGMGVMALDSLRAQLASDSVYLRFVELYPYLYSGLDAANSARAPKLTESALVYDKPTDCQLLPPYPNPAKNETYVTIRLDDSRSGRLVVYNMHGAVMTEREIRDCSRGTHTFRLNTALWTSGLYVVKLILGAEVLTQKLLLTH
ncbi:MAG: T9SS type A sorting domain-containing protein [Bacteroidia bacterium]|nr:T9SS type A sorting domain-containing protein [Bacteroidia bacterium]